MKRTIVTLCGSTRFKQAFIDANFEETMAGKVVLSVGWFSHADGHVYAPTGEEKAALDALHLDKIAMSDSVLVLNVLHPRRPRCRRWWKEKAGLLFPDCECGAGVEKAPCVGSSTAKEIAYALSLGKPVRYLNEPGEGAADA